MINTVYLVDDSQLLMLTMSLQTLVKNVQVKDIVIAYFDVPLCKVKATIKSIGIENVKYFPLDKSLVDQFFPKKESMPALVNDRLYYPSLLRWFLHRISLNDFWYFDTDVLVTSDITEYLETISKDQLFVAFNRKDYDKAFYKTGIGNIIQTSDINAGVMYVNNKLYNELHLFEEIIRFYKDFSSQIKYVNQTAYSYLFNKYNCKLIISKEYNSKIWDMSRYKELVKYIKIHHITGENKNLFYKIYNDA